MTTDPLAQHVATFSDDRDGLTVVTSASGALVMIAWKYQASIDCCADIPVVAPSEIDMVTDGMPELARSPAA